MDYSKTTYGRNDEVEALYGLFDRGKDVSMPGARRLGKSFVLERLTDASVRNGWTTVNVDVSDWNEDEPTCAFLNPLLRLWWKKFTPSPS